MTEPKLTTVYKKNGGSMEVNSDMLPHLASLNLTKTNPNAETKEEKAAKAEAAKEKKEKAAAAKKAKAEAAKTAK